MDISLDIGVVTYRISSNESLDASWYSTGLSGYKKGTGTAQGDTSKGFEGLYKITYFDSNGSEIGVFDLEIIKVNEIFQVFWKQENEILFVGVGIETSDNLSVGWRKNQSES